MDPRDVRLASWFHVAPVHAKKKRAPTTSAKWSWNLGSRSRQTRIAPMSDQRITIIIPSPPPAPAGRPVLVAVIGAVSVVVAAVVGGIFALACALAQHLRP